jgi:hypothetical protein
MKMVLGRFENNLHISLVKIFINGSSKKYGLFGKVAWSMIRILEKNIKTWG